MRTSSSRLSRVAHFCISGTNTKTSSRIEVVSFEISLREDEIVENDDEEDDEADEDDEAEADDEDDEADEDKVEEQDGKDKCR